MHISLIPETLIRIGNFGITNTLLTSWLILISICFFAIAVSVKIRTIPGKIQNVIEASTELFIDFMTTISGSREKAIRFFPIVGSIFILILISNWFGILPGVGSVGFYEIHDGHKTFVPYFRSVNSDLNMTLALAFIVVTLSHFIGIISIGVSKHLGKYITFKSPTAFFVGGLEFIGEFSKIVSFSFRLFGNIFAGEVLLVIMTFLVPYIAPIPFLGLEVFVGLVQALIFSVLAMMFLSSATESHH